MRTKRTLQQTTDTAGRKDRIGPLSVVLGWTTSSVNFFERLLTAPLSGDVSRSSPGIPISVREHGSFYETSGSW